MTRARKRLIAGAVLALVAVFLLAYGLSPVFAAQGLVSAARAGDVAGLERRVDFPAVREDLKVQLRERLSRELTHDARLGGALADLGMMLAPALVDGAVETVVTPANLAALVRTAETPRSGEPAEAPPSEDEGPDTEVRYSYRDLNTFGARVFDPSRPEQSVDLVMTRRGLFDWKLSRVVLPD